jgi:hypothetical protein
MLPKPNYIEMTKKLLTFAEFASLAGIKSNALSVFVQRSKVIIASTSGKERLIDPANPVNKEFLKARDLIKARKAFELSDTAKEETKQGTADRGEGYFAQTKKAELIINVRIAACRNRS